MRRSIDPGVVGSHRAELRELPFDLEAARGRRVRRRQALLAIAAALVIVLVWWVL